MITYKRNSIFWRYFTEATISIKLKPYISIYKWNEGQEDMRYFLIRTTFIRFRPDSFKHDKINNKYNKNQNLFSLITSDEIT
tara:strand:- start:438 stop:683 length:246 start_codon:yes stop_codon:yes gene_type:complete